MSHKPPDPWVTIAVCGGDMKDELRKHQRVCARCLGRAEEAMIYQSVSNTRKHHQGETQHPAGQLPQAPKHTQHSTGSQAATFSSAHEQMDLHHGDEWKVHVTEYFFHTEGC